MQNKKIVFLVPNCELSRWVYNAVLKPFDTAAATIETPVSKKTLFKGPIKGIGFFKVMGQTLFSVFVVPCLLKKASRHRLQLIQQYQLDNIDFKASQTHHCVASGNDDDGVDTGAVLTLVFARPTPADKFTCYLVILVKEGIELVKNLLQQAGTAAYKGINHTENGQLYYQATFLQYITSKNVFSKYYNSA